MKKLVLPVVALLACAVWAMAAYEHGFAHFLGIDTQSSQNYDFVSGVGPMLLTALGLGTIITGLWHSINCHEPGCIAIGRHKIDGTPWCNTHHLHARKRQACLDDVVDRLDRLLTLIDSDTDKSAKTTAAFLAHAVSDMPEVPPPAP